MPVYVAQLLALPIVDLLVPVVNAERPGAEMAVLAAVGKGGDACGQAVAQRPGA